MARLPQRSTGIMERIQTKQFERLGLECSRTTLSRWTARCGELVQPLINLLRDELLALEVIHIDETTVQVLKETGKAAQSTSYIWAQCSGQCERPIGPAVVRTGQEQCAQ
jgi:hypothetical protein